MDPPLMHLALAAYIRQYGYSVRILDCNAEFHTTDEEFEAYFLTNYVERYAHINVIGISTTTPTINASFRVAAICKKYFPDCVMIFGGAHASFIPDESLDKDFVDVVCIGEGEETLKEVLDGKPYPDIKGLAHKMVINGEKTFIKNPPRARLKKLDDLPPPAYDLIDMGIYRPIIGNFRRLPAMMLVSSRGCPWPCNFCRRPVGRMWTYRSAQSLYDEFKHLSEVHGIKDIAIMDDVFTVNKERVFEFCDLLIQHPLDIEWLCFARVDIVSPEMLHKMKEAGCWQIMYGVENFNQSILDSIQKGIAIQQIFDAVGWSKKAGLAVRVCMMVGNDGDTKPIIEQNIKLLKKLDPDYISVAILTPFPGHDIYNQAIAQDRILTYDWDLYYGSTPIYRLDTLSPEEVFSLYRKMTFSFYFRPSFIFKKLMQLRSGTELWHNIKGFIGLFTFRIEKLLPKRSVDNRKKKQVEKLSPKEIALRREHTESATKQTAIT
ncbi:MAG: radical SAM protein [Chitinophagales bacterium]|nr:radical SAM protein [Chitinophagales bacterium]